MARAAWSCPVQVARPCAWIAAFTRARGSESADSLQRIERAVKHQERAVGQCRRSISQLHHRCSISIIGIAILCCCLNTGGYAASENAQKSEPTRCPPDGSRIALFSRQAIDQGREQENKEYARFTEELFAISTSSSVEGEVVEKSI